MMQLQDAVDGGYCFRCYMQDGKKNKSYKSEMCVRHFKMNAHGTQDYKKIRALSTTQLRTLITNAGFNHKWIMSEDVDIRRTLLIAMVAMVKGWDIPLQGIKTIWAKANKEGYLDEH